MTCNLDPIDSFLAVTDYSATSPRTMKNSAGQIGFAPHNLILASEDFSDSNWTKTDTTVTPNAATAPDGTITADKISHDDTTASLYQGGVSVVSGQTYAMGIGVKYIDHQWVRLSADGQVSWVDIQNGVVGTDNSSGLTLTALTDNWFWVTIPVSVSDASFDFAVALSAGNNNNTETSGTSAYIWGAHLYENGLAGMFDVPEDERALASLTKYLPNKAVVTGPNLVSNGTFDSNTNGWTDESELSGSTSWDASGQISLNNPAASSTEEGRVYQVITTEVGAAYKLTFEKDGSGGASIVQAGTNGSRSAYYQSDNDVLPSAAHFVATTTITYITLRNFNNVTPALVDNITVTKVDRDPTAARFLPRRDNHEDIDGAWVKGLKVESEARTNLVTDGNAIQDRARTRTVVTDDYASSPHGSSVRLVDDSSTGSNSAFIIAGTFTVATSSEYTFWGLYKKDQIDWVGLQTVNFTTPANVISYFDLNNGVVGTAGSGHTQHMADVGDGWYLCGITFTTDASDTSGSIRVYLADADNDSTVDLDGTSSILIADFDQFEAGSTPSSLIPTYGATRTRTAETFTQKSDKIIWPNTTYVDGTELVTNGGFDTDTDWTKGTGWTIGSGVATKTAGSSSAINQGGSITSGSVYECTVTISGYSAGTLYWRLGDTTNLRSMSADGTYTFVLIGSATGSYIGLFGDATFVGTIDNISVKEINPRALAVVMHGYMTYADTESIEATFLRQQASSGNLIQWYLNTTDTGVTRTGEVVFDQQSNGTSDTTTADPEGYSPGINVPIKIASRHLDNALQAAADGTATTENTTPPGLPDLSATQTEWFYDFMGHVTFVGKGQESTADRLDETNGPTTLELATDGSWP